MPLQVQLNAAQLQLPAAAAADAVPSAADDSSSRAFMRSSSAISVPLAVIVSATASTSAGSARRPCRDGPAPNAACCPGASASPAAQLLARLPWYYTYALYIAQPGKVADFECPVLTRCEFEPVMFGRRNQPHHQAAATRSESAESADLNSKLGTKRRQPERSQPGAAHEAGWVAR